ncbi:GDSL-like Lipase/Acylhydrolase family protein [Sphingomonas laterariae]|uniref:GDSL-like Lipase/Acylhydrolase family protein n=1 Tax=Edaphosphingomonas laterariae TaxID=861865 RepID=A0A239F9U0_9SPHN|nr:GDSL-type esterase/lipase family protein [Sphingomonas laterariae]SNS52854.1 GDSL-like Lipase/Acylhydrolase family protein [Sphingomonas laterariae]
MANAKISELGAAAALSGAEKVPVVQGGANAAATPEQLRTFARFVRPVNLIVDGDSKGVQVGNMSHASALFWALARTGRIANFNPATDSLAVGSTVSGTNGGAVTGLISAGRLNSMIARVQAVAATGADPVIILKIGANDVGLTAPETVLANVRRYWETARAAGAVRLLLMSVDPRVATAGAAPALSSAVARAGHAINAAYRAYAAASPDIIMVDSHNALTDPTNDLFYPIGGVSAAGFASMLDGLHESQYGAWLQSKALGDALRLVGRPLPAISGAMINGVTGWSATEPRGNVLGNEARFGGTGGTSGNVALTGGGGVTGIDQFPAAKLFGAYPNLGGTLSGTLAVAISSVAYQPMADQDRPDHKATRLTFTGTPSANGSLAIAAVAQKPSGWDYTIPLDWDADLYCNALTGCAGLSLVLSAGGSGLTIGGNDATLLPALTGRLIPHRPAPSVASADPANITLELRINWRAGMAMSGSIDLFGMGISQARPIPVAS